MQKEKNPWAVKVGQRLQKARDMAGFHTQQALLEQVPDWSPSRYGNYEAGISLAPPDVIVHFCEITRTSPCWVFFGIGPIRANNRDIHAVRHQNLDYFFQQVKNKPADVKRFIKTLGLSRPKLEQLLNNPFANISDRFARRSESFFNKPKGWMDEQHVESDPLCLSFPEDMRELMMLFSDMDGQNRSKLLEIAKILASP